MNLSNKGFTLVEVLIATVVLTLVGLGAFQLLNRSTKTYAQIDDAKIDKLMQLRLMRVLENEVYCKEIISHSNPNFINIGTNDLVLPTTIIKNKYSSIYNIGISFSDSTKDLSALIEKSTLKDKNLSIEHDISRSFTFSKIKLLKNPNFNSLITTTPLGEQFSITIPTLFEVAKFDGNNFSQNHFTSRVDRPTPLTFVFQKSSSGLVLSKCFSRGSRAIVTGTQICNSLGGTYNDANGCNFYKFKGNAANFEKNIRYQNVATSKLDFQKYACALDKKVVQYEKQDEPAVMGPEINLLKTMKTWQQYVVQLTPLAGFASSFGTSHVIIPKKNGNPNAKTNYCP